jgi:transcriptional regulator with XRE-family HTH domain
VYMARTQRKHVPPPSREPTWRRTNMVHWRKHVRLTQEMVAVAVGASYVTVGRWERGEVPPDANALETLARLYGTDIHSMLNRLPAISDKK